MLNTIDVELLQAQSAKSHDKSDVCPKVALFGRDSANSRLTTRSIQRLWQGKLQSVESEVGTRAIAS